MEFITAIMMLLANCVCKPLSLNCFNNQPDQKLLVYVRRFQISDCYTSISTNSDTFSECNKIGCLIAPSLLYTCLDRPLQSMVYNK